MIMDKHYNSLAIATPSLSSVKYFKIKFGKSRIVSAPELLQECELLFISLVYTNSYHWSLILKSSKMFKLPIARDALPPQRTLKHYLFVQRFCFAAVGIDPTSLECTIYNRFLAWVPMLAIATLIGPMTSYALAYVEDDWDQMASALSPMWQSLLSIAKFVLVMWNKKKIVQLVREVWLWNLEANDDELQILAEENRYDFLVSLFYYSSVCVTAILATVSPFLIAAFFAWKGYGFWDSLNEPLKAVYFIDHKKSVLAYTFCFVWNVFGMYYVVHGTLAIDSLFSWFMRNISAQFRILNIRFKQVAENIVPRNGQDKESEEKLSKSIIACAQYHRRVIELADKFNEVFRHIVFIKFLISCVQLACLTFQFPHGGDVASQVFNFSFLISVTTQQMLYCYGGQRIQDMSFSVNLAIYEHFRWHDMSVKSQKLLMLPIMRSQKPCNLMGIFFVVDLGLFVWVFKTAASFMTMMMSVEAK